MSRRRGSPSLLDYYPVTAKRKVPSSASLEENQHLRAKSRAADVGATPTATAGVGGVVHGDQSGQNARDLAPAGLSTIHTTSSAPKLAAASRVEIGDDPHRLLSSMFRPPAATPTASTASTVGASNTSTSAGALSSTSSSLPLSSASMSSEAAQSIIARQRLLLLQQQPSPLPPSNSRPPASSSATTTTTAAPASIRDYASHSLPPFSSSSSSYSTSSSSSSSSSVLGSATMMAHALLSSTASSKSSLLATSPAANATAATTTRPTSATAAVATAAAGIGVNTSASRSVPKGMAAAIEAVVSGAVPISAQSERGISVSSDDARSVSDTATRLSNYASTILQPLTVGRVYDTGVCLTSDRQAATASATPSLTSLLSSTSTISSSSSARLSASLTTMSDASVIARAEQFTEAVRGGRVLPLPQHYKDILQDFINLETRVMARIASSQQYFVWLSDMKNPAEGAPSAESLGRIAYIYPESYSFELKPNQRRGGATDIAVTPLMSCPPSAPHQAALAAAAAAAKAEAEAEAETAAAAAAASATAAAATSTAAANSSTTSTSSARGKTSSSTSSSSSSVAAIISPVALNAPQRVVTVAQAARDHLTTYRQERLAILKDRLYLLTHRQHYMFLASIMQDDAVKEQGKHAEMHVKYPTSSTDYHRLCKQILPLAIRAMRQVEARVRQLLEDAHRVPMLKPTQKPTVDALDKAREASKETTLTLPAWMHWAPNASARSILSSSLATAEKEAVDSKIPLPSLTDWHFAFYDHLNEIPEIPTTDFVRVSPSDVKSQSSTLANLTATVQRDRARALLASTASSFSAALSAAAGGRGMGGSGVQSSPSRPVATVTTTQSGSHGAVTTMRAQAVMSPIRPHTSSSSSFSSHTSSQQKSFNQQHSNTDSSCSGLYSLSSVGLSSPASAVPSSSLAAPTSSSSSSSSTSCASAAASSSALSSSLSSSSSSASTPALTNTVADDDAGSESDGSSSSDDSVYKNLDPALRARAKAGTAKMSREHSEEAASLRSEITYLQENKQMIIHLWFAPPKGMSIKGYFEQQLPKFIVAKQNNPRNEQIRQAVDIALRVQQLLPDMILRMESKESGTISIKITQSALGRQTEAIARIDQMINDKQVKLNRILHPELVQSQPLPQLQPQRAVADSENAPTDGMTAVTSVTPADNTSLLEAATPAKSSSGYIDLSEHVLAGNLPSDTDSTAATDPSHYHRLPRANVATFTSVITASSSSQATKPSSSSASSSSSSSSSSSPSASSSSSLSSLLISPSAASTTSASSASLNDSMITTTTLASSSSFSIAGSYAAESSESDQPTRTNISDHLLQVLAQRTAKLPVVLAHGRNEMSDKSSDQLNKKQVTRSSRSRAAVVEPSASAASIPSTSGASIPAVAVAVVVDADDSASAIVRRSSPRQRRAA